MLYFSQTILYVENVHKSVAFYKEAFGLDERFISEGGTYAEIESQTVSLAFARKSFVSSHLATEYQSVSLSDPPPAFEIAFVVDNVMGAYEQAIRAGATTVAPPVTKPWGQVVAYVRDIDGFLIEIGQKM